MKKNKMLRAASLLLVLVLLTTSIIGGTFAKYTTTGSGSDVARVAKWGVEVSTTGHLFEKTYTKDAEVEDTTITNTVVSSGDYEVVAPGTKNEDGITFEIKGQPEVAVKLDVVVKSSATDSTAAKDVFLKAGTYADLTTGTSTSTVNGVSTVTGNNDTFAVDNDYYPIVYTLKNGAGQVLATGNLAAIEEYLEGLSDEYAANTNLNTIKTNSDGTYKLTWAWAFENTNADKADTFLGALAAGDPLAKKGADLGENVADTDYCLTPDIVITITATQID